MHQKIEALALLVSGYVVGAVAAGVPEVPGAIPSIAMLALGYWASTFGTRAWD